MSGNLAALKRPVNQDIVRKLEELLDQARKGEVTGFTCSVELAGGVIDTYTDSLDLVTVLGHLARQMHIAQTALDKSAME